MFLKKLVAFLCAIKVLSCLDPACEKLPGAPRSMLGCCNFPYIQHDEESLRCTANVEYMKGPNILSNCVRESFFSGFSLGDCLKPVKNISENTFLCIPQSCRG